MGKKKNKTTVKLVTRAENIPIQDMTYKDIKKACVIRGMDFEEVIKGDFPRLHSWLHNNFGNKQDTQLLNDFDDWMELHLKHQRQDDLIHPQLRLGYVGDKEDSDELKPRKVKEKREPKAAREKTELGVYKGTKKALTLELAEAGKSFEETFEEVQKQFPDAVEKSCKIWYKKYLRDK